MRGRVLRWKCYGGQASHQPLKIIKVTTGLDFDATASQAPFSINSCRRPAHYGAKPGASDLHDHNWSSATFDTKHNPTMTTSHRSICRLAPFSPYTRKS